MSTRGIELNRIDVVCDLSTNTLIRYDQVTALWGIENETESYNLWYRFRFGIILFWWCVNTIPLKRTSACGGRIKIHN